MTRGLASAAEQLASYGRGNDTMLAHITPGEARFIDALQGGRRTNPATGLPEYGMFGKLLKAAVRVGAAVGGFVLSGGNPVAAGAASAAATKLTGGSWKQSLKSGAITGLTAGIGNAVSGPSMWASEGLKAGAGAAAPGILTKEIGGVGTGEMLKQEAVKQALSQGANQSALGGLYSGIGGATGTAVGLSALTGAPLGPTASDQPPPGLPEGFGGNINLNVQPLNRTYMPYGGDPLKYGQKPGGHRFFDPTNPKPVFIEPAKDEAVIEEQFMARGGGVRRYQAGGSVDEVPGFNVPDPNNPSWPFWQRDQAIHSHTVAAAQAAQQKPPAQRDKYDWDALRRGLQYLGDLSPEEYKREAEMMALQEGIGADANPQFAGPGGMARGGRMRRIGRAISRGKVRGPGGPIGDKIPAMLSDGEHVVDSQTITLAGKGNNDKGQQVMERIKQRIRARAGMKNPKKPPAFGGA